MKIDHAALPGAALAAAVGMSPAVRVMASTRFSAMRTDGHARNPRSATRRLYVAQFLAAIAFIGSD
ncbi:hypothetical protein [Lentzea nigeriaca]|uniref:hypothetical protein n=1 Tax=Lentzea nigeriaca TaxID=1128665 RepID=UPI00195D3371|nr:hypothetical protein [Lentzea nigeriaca]MBM7863074.1 hypothetical protein [Lentzea nigeriaca]